MKVDNENTIKKGLELVEGSGQKMFISAVERAELFRRLGVSHAKLRK